MAVIQWRNFFQKVHTRSQRLLLLVDVVMLFLVFVDLFWMVLDVALMQFCESRLGEWFPSFSRWYIDEVHPWFLVVDGLLIILFLTEFFVRWAVAIWQKTHPKWFFYPVVNWYDLLGSIPSSSFRFVRLFRIIAMAYRLHRWGVLDVRQLYLFDVGMRYYQIVMEEVSDRVAVKILQEVKLEMQRTPPLTEQILEDVVLPKKPHLVEWTASKLRQALAGEYATYRQAIREYVEKIVRESMEQSREVGQLERVPVVGGYLKDTLNNAVCSIVFGVFDRLVGDLAAEDRQFVLEAITDALISALLAEPSEQGDLSTTILAETMDVIIQRVSEKNWLVVEQARKEKKGKI